MTVHSQVRLVILWAIFWADSELFRTSEHFLLAKMAAGLAWFVTGYWCSRLAFGAGRGPFDEPMEKR